MMLKFGLFLLLVAGASAGRRYYGVPYAQPTYAYGYAAAEEQPVFVPEKAAVEEGNKQQAQPFQFGYQIQDDDGNTQLRQESGDEFGRVTGSYGYKDAFGIYRQVTYVADENGFRAVIKSNEPGVQSDNPADVTIQHDEPPNTVVPEEKTAAAFASATKLPIGIGPAYSEPYRYVAPVAPSYGYPFARASVAKPIHSVSPSYYGYPVARATVAKPVLSVSPVQRVAPGYGYSVPQATVAVPVVKPVAPIPAGATYFRYQSARIHPRKY